MKGRFSARYPPNGRNSFHIRLSSHKTGTQELYRQFQGSTCCRELELWEHCRQVCVDLGSGPGSSVWLWVRYPTFLGLTLWHASIGKQYPPQSSVRIQWHDTEPTGFPVCSSPRKTAKHLITCLRVVFLCVLALTSCWPSKTLPIYSFQISLPIPSPGHSAHPANAYL